MGNCKNEELRNAGRGGLVPQWGCFLNAKGSHVLSWIKSSCVEYGDGVESN